ncbi:MAG: GNAT family N-acetyltransferase [Deltaproteobacteria bacterium]|nr:GNAT family N-acetyltransferase [Deltaproteobacteria bacterium]MBN2671046.1 GNAT family N-acetyltransferase [Deltaproteobacteria bacterium]
MTVIRQISEKEVPMNMLLHADPSEKCIDRYLPGSKCFGVFVEDELVGVCVANLNDDDIWEIFNIVVIPEKQKQGFGKKLLEFVINYFEELGASSLELGTGTFGYQLLFYQRAGFRVESIRKNFFIDNYSELIFEDGVQLKDMLRLCIRYNRQSTYPAHRSQPRTAENSSERHPLLSTTECRDCNDILDEADNLKID